jgi:hypothetical protein
MPSYRFSSYAVTLGLGSRALTPKLRWLMAETFLKPRLARKYLLSIAMLLISLVVAAAPVAVAVSGSSHSHVKVQVRPQLDFGVLSSGPGTKTFTSALAVGKGRTSPMTFAFVNPSTTWSTVFSGITIIVQTKGAAPLPTACISLGTGACPAGVTATFTPTTGTTYDYVVSFTTVPTVPSGVTLKTTWSF